VISPPTTLAEVYFRSLTPRDASEVAYLELEIFRYPWSENSLRNCLELATVEGEAAMLDGKIVGYLILQCVFEEAHILNLAVHHHHRGRGIARTLLERFLGQTVKRGINRLFLEVRTSNYMAQKLYFSLGFAPLGARRNYYPDGEDALVLVKKL
jgi:ribosomal-protein-alanine N-acetyltransferase